MNRPTATASHKASVDHEAALQRPRLAILGSSGLAYLRALICAASIRQGFDVDFFPSSCADYGNLLADRSSDICVFRPKVVLLTVAADCLGAARASRGLTALGHWAKQQLGAALVRTAILPILLPLCQVQGHRSQASAFSLLEVMELKLSSASGQEGMQLPLGRGPGSPETFMQWHVPPIWRGRGSKRTRIVLDDYPAARAFAALFGLNYFCVVVDVNNHPWMVDRDIATFLLLWDKTQSFARAGRAAVRCPDCFLFVDYDPLVTASQRLRHPLESVTKDGRVSAD